MTTTAPSDAAADPRDEAIAPLVDGLVEAGFLRRVPPDEAQALERVHTAIAKVTSGETINFGDLLKLIAPEPVEPPPPAAPPAVPAITEAQRAALTKVVEVFGGVVPETRRTLTTPEVARLIEERLTLDEIENLAKKRKEGIRTTVCNHLDVKVEEEAAEARAAGETVELPQRAADGHYIKAGKVGAPGQPQQFSRETRSGSVSVDPDLLRALADDPALQQALADAGVTFTHDDYLAMTRPVRVIDEARVMLHLRQHPSLVHALKLATKTGQPSAAVSMRKA